MTSTHYGMDRLEREQLIASIGEGHVCASFIVDHGHKDGPEKHCITDNAIIIIYNAITEKMVTKLIARPGQIRRYYPEGNAPENLVRIAREHTWAGYNEY